MDELAVAVAASSAVVDTEASTREASVEVEVEVEVSVDVAVSVDAKCVQDAHKKSPDASGPKTSRIHARSTTRYAKHANSAES